MGEASRNSLAEDLESLSGFIYGETGAGKSAFERRAIVERIRKASSSKPEMIVYVPPTREVDSPLDEMWFEQEDIEAGVDCIEEIWKRSHVEP